jgi:hypothetical protein
MKTKTPGDTPLSDTEREILTKLFNAGAARVKEDDEYWIHGDDETISYCYKCAKKECTKLLKDNPKGSYIVSGGWGNEGDSTPFCETCGKRLSNSFTNFACEQEVEHYTKNGFDIKCKEHCCDMAKVIDARGWEPWKKRIYEHKYQQNDYLEYYANLNTLCRTILRQLQKNKKTHKQTRKQSRKPAYPSIT